jgi:AcrR family transcriptional regulator
MAKPAFKRLGVGERREQLLLAGEQLFLTHDYSKLSMAAIARSVGISKPLLYHYFPSKQAYFQATFQNYADELRGRIEPDPSLPPEQALAISISSYLEWIDEHGAAYAKLIETAGAVPEIRALVDEVRTETSARILDGLDVHTPQARTVVEGWLGFMDSVCLDWIEHRDLDKNQIQGILIGTLLAALASASSAR